MRRIFDADSPLMRFLTNVADLMILNLLFVFLSLPVVTLGATLTALNHTAMKVVTGECESVTGEFLRSFRANFRQATILGLAVGCLALALAGWYVVVENLAVPAVVRLVLLAVFFLVVFRFVLTALYVFPYHAKFENSVWEVLNNSRRMSVRHLFSSLTVLAVTALPVVITVFYPRMTVYGLLWFLIGFAGIAVVNAVLFTRIFGTYIPRPVEAKG
ncbi:YesL family protein [Promicromonospora panici]|uniref:YesL family protein n=1 Tax=Promicromonospora panici TaxID=2219658 RepID=UPI00101C5AB6|nr:YesL family protein [Promicromonospora panici]